MHRQDQHFDHGENDDQRGDEHRHLRAGADRAAGRDRRRDAADRYARGQRRRPFAAEAEPLAGDEINHRPIDQIGLDDRREPAQQNRGREIELARRRDRNERAEDDDGDLDVELGTDRGLEPFGEAREKIRDDEAREKRDNVAAFAGELQRPAERPYFAWSAGVTAAKRAQLPTNQLA